MRRLLENKTFLWTVAGLYLAAVMFLCFWEFSSLDEESINIFGEFTDKVVHFCMFFPFPVIAIGIFRQYGIRLAKAVAVAVVCGIVFAIFTESVQYFLPGRAFEWADWFSDSAAIGISAIFAYIYLR